MDSDYKIRFKQEYDDLRARIERLQVFLSGWGDMDHLPPTPKWVFEDQLASMKQYAHVLTTRAVMEQIDIKELIK